MDTLVITMEHEYEYIRRCLKAPVKVIVWEYSAEVGDIEWEQFRCVVIAIRDIVIREQIEEYIKFSGFDKVIIDFYQFYEATIPVRHSDRVLGNPCIKEIKGLIFGISHAEVGLISEMFKVPFANLAVSSQDIYYDFKVLKDIVDKYYLKLKNVKYVIIDMFRYNYFNYDVSLSITAYDYYCLSGIMDDPHHYEAEKYKYLETVFLEKRLGEITSEKIDFWEKIFGDVHRADAYRAFKTFREIYMRNKVVNDEDVQKYDFNKSNVRKRFDSTICENKECLKNMLQFIRNIWSDARIILLHMPLYELAIKYSRNLYADWKQEFYEIMEEMRREIEFEYVDYTEHPISKDKSMWYDFEHLNYMGAIRFTQEINKLL